MAKKGKKVRKAKLSQSQLVRPSAQAAVEAVTVEELPIDLDAAADFSQEYHYVIEDLKRIGILAAGMLVVLLVLSFFV